MFYREQTERRFGADDAALAAFVEAAMSEAASLGIESRDAVGRHVEDRLTGAEATSPDGARASLSIGTARFDDPVESMPKRRISCRYVEARVRCGDSAHVEVEAEGLPAETPVSAEILRIADGGVLATISGKLAGRLSRFEWHPSRLPGMAAHDGFLLQASADGLVAQGPEVLTFETHLPIISEVRTVERRMDPFAWTGRHRISFDGERVLIEIRIRFISRLGRKPGDGDGRPDEAVAPPEPLLSFIKAETEQFLSARFGLIRDGCRLGTGCSCVKPVVFQIDFVERNEDHVVELYSGEAGAMRGGAHAWTLKRLWRGQWAHSVGHLLGWLDDPDDAAGLMGAGDLLRPENLADVRSWLSAKTNQSWSLANLEKPS
jgi:hypothetical protein